MKILFDTCVIIDALQKREPFYEDARALLLAVASEQIEAFLTAKSVSDIYYLIHRHFHDIPKSKKVINDLLSVMSVLDTCAIDCRTALIMGTGDYEDAIMMATASRAKMDGIVTRNGKDYAASAIKIYTPKELLAAIENELL